MTLRAHASLCLQAVAAWAFFWLLGWPSYYQQYSPALLGAGSVLLSALISLGITYVLQGARRERRMRLAWWYAFYFTVPLAGLDTLYCGLYLGHGHDYIVKYWYLSVFYLSPWLSFAPTAWVLNREPPAGASELGSAR